MTYSHVGCRAYRELFSILGRKFEVREDDRVGRMEPKPALYARSNRQKRDINDARSAAAAAQHLN